MEQRVDMEQLLVQLGSQMADMAQLRWEGTPTVDMEQLLAQLGSQMVDTAQVYVQLG